MSITSLQEVKAFSEDRFTKRVLFQQGGGVTLSFIFCQVSSFLFINIRAQTLFYWWSKAQVHLFWMEKNKW